MLRPGIPVPAVRLVGRAGRAGARDRAAGRRHAGRRRRRGPVRYQADVRRVPARGAGARRDLAGRRARGDPAVRARADRGPLGSARDRPAHRGALRARTSSTRSTRRTAPGDPLVHFLLRSKAGHCEYFASAAAMMLTARGIPRAAGDGLLRRRGGPALAARSSCARRTSTPGSRRTSTARASRSSIPTPPAGPAARPARPSRCSRAWRPSAARSSSSTTGASSASTPATRSAPSRRRASRCPTPRRQPRRAAASRRGTLSPAAAAAVLAAGTARGWLLLAGALRAAPAPRPGDAGLPRAARDCSRAGGAGACPPSTPPAEVARLFAEARSGGRATTRARSWRSTARAPSGASSPEPTDAARSLSERAAAACRKLGLARFAGSRDARATTTRHVVLLGRRRPGTASTASSTAPQSSVGRVAGVARAGSARGAPRRTPRRRRSGASVMPSEKTTSRSPAASATVSCR